MPVTDRRHFGRGQTPRLVALEAFVLCQELRLFDQSLFPLALESASNQPVLRLDGIELPTRPFGPVAGTLESVSPLSIQRRALAFQLASGQQAHLQ